MKTVEKEQLIEYLKHGISVASELYGLATILGNFEVACEKNKPYWVEKPLPTQPTLKPAQSTKKDGITMVTWGAVVIVVAAVLVGVMGEESDLVMGILNGLMKFLGYLLIVLGIALGIIGASTWIKAEDMASSNEKASRSYETQRQAVIDENARRQKEYQKRREQWTKSKIKGLEQIQAKLEEIEKVSDEYFSVDIIFPKYRSLVALSSFYEYLSSGRCEELTGPNGAYNLYEMESRQNIIITQLDAVLKNLENIQQNQYVLYKELKKTTSTLNQISSDLSVVKSLTFDLTEIASLNLYYNSVTAANTSALMFLETIR